MIADFDALVHPATRAEFLAHFEAKTPFYIQATDPDRARYLLPSRRIDELITSGVMWPDRLRVMRDGRDLPEAFYTIKERMRPVNPVGLGQLMRQGASIVLKQLGTIVSEIGDLEQMLQRELQVDGWTNAYLSYAQGGALNRHYDDHDVLVVQVDGRKRWRLFGQTEVTPLRPPADRDPRPDQVVDEHSLGPGDVLFVPRGVWHQAELQSAASVHLTIAMRGYTGVRLVETLAAKSEGDELFRRYAPRTGGAEAVDLWEQDLKARLHALIDELSLSEALAQWDTAIRPRPVLRLGSPAELAADTILRTASRRRLDPAAIAAGVGRPLSPPARLALEAIDARAETSFAALVETLAGGGLDGDAAAQAVAELADQGLVIIHDPK